jgi:hypothetical protein
VDCVRSALVSNGQLPGMPDTPELVSVDKNWSLTVSPRATLGATLVATRAAAEIASAPATFTETSIKREWSVMSLYFLWITKSNHCRNFWNTALLLSHLEHGPVTVGTLCVS